MTSDYIRKQSLLFLVRILILTLPNTVLAQELTYRFSLVNEATTNKLNLSTPLNYENRILPQPKTENLAVANLFLNYGVVSVSLNGSASANNISKPDYSSSLREVYVDYSLTDELNILVGKKILKWGTGYAFNPTGVVEPQRNPSDPSDRLNQYEGRKLLSLGGFVGGSSLTLVYLNDVSLRESKLQSTDHELAVRVYSLVGGVDLSLIAHFKQRQKPEAGMNAAYVVGSNLELHAEVLAKQSSRSLYHRVITSDDERQFFSSYPYVPLYENSGRIFYKLLLGGQYTFESGLNITLEYFHNEEGLSEKEWKQWMRFIKFHNDIQQGNIVVPPALVELSRYNLLWSLQTVSPRGTMRDYLFARGYYTLDAWSFELMYFTNIADLSAVVIPSVSSRLSEYVSVYSRFTLFLGKDDSEYGALFNRYAVNLGIRFQL